MSLYVKTTEDIYNLVQDLLDGDEFQSDDAALRSMNAKYQILLGTRDWYFLRKTATLSVADLSLAQITDLSKVLAVRYVNENGDINPDPLREAPYGDRYNTEFDYWIDYENNKIEPITEITVGSLLVDYKKTAPELGFTAVAYSAGPPVIEEIAIEPLIPRAYRPLIALAMVHDFKKADEAQEMFREHGFDEEELTNEMINDDTSHQKYYA